MADTKCKWEQDEVCVNADCPLCADFCPVSYAPGVCKFEDRSAGRHEGGSTMDDLREKALEAQREYARKWRAKNKDKVRETNRRYWERVAQRTNAAAEPDKREEVR